MKKLVLSGAIILLATGAFAQTNMTGADARIGIKAGINLANINNSRNDDNQLNTKSKNNVGYNFTVFGDFGVGNNFFIQPGISLQNKGYKAEEVFNINGKNISGTSTVNIMAIEVPINAIVRIPTGNAGALQVNAGPYIGFNVSGKEKYELAQGDGAQSVKEETTLKFGSKKESNYSSTDFGANFGLAYRTKAGVLVGANYGLGLSNLIPKDKQTTNDHKASNRVLGFTIGYSF